MSDMSQCLTVCRQSRNSRSSSSSGINCINFLSFNNNSCRYLFSPSVLPALFFSNFISWSYSSSSFSYSSLSSWTSHGESHVLPDALGVRLNISGYACNLGLHSYVLFPCRIRQVPTLQVIRCISACVYAAFKISICRWSSLKSA